MILCEEDPYVLELVRYIHLNPVRAGLVAGLTSPLADYTKLVFSGILLHLDTGRPGRRCEDNFTQPPGVLGALWPDVHVALLLQLHQSRNATLRQILGLRGKLLKGDVEGFHRVSTRPKDHPLAL